MKEITVDELRALGEGGATILNVGSHQGRREIRGAVRYRPHDLLTPEHLALPISHDRPVVPYDEKGGAGHTKEVAEKLASEGYDVRILQGGFAAWEQAGGPTQEPTIEQVVPPMRASEVQELDRRV